MSQRIEIRGVRVESESAATEVRRALERLDGVDWVGVDFGQQRVVVDGTVTRDDIVDALRRIGLEPARE